MRIFHSLQFPEFSYFSLKLSFLFISFSFILKAFYKCLFLDCLIMVTKKATYKFTLSSSLKIGILNKHCSPRGSWQARDSTSLMLLNSSMLRGFWFGLSTATPSALTSTTYFSFFREECFGNSGHGGRDNGGG